MSEEFEEISVAETEVAPAGAAPAGVEAPVVPEAMPAEVDATKVNLDAGDSVMRQNAQQTFLENSGSERAGGTAPLTAAAIEAKEEERKEKIAAMQEALDNQAKDQDRHREWMERQHEFGGMKMSGHDLDKMMNFYANNPQMMDKLKERMTKSGMPKDKVEKGMKEFQEAMELKKKEKDGTITDDERRRYLELQKSEELKKVTEAAAQHTRDNGVDLKTNNTAEVRVAIGTGDQVAADTSRQQLIAQDKTSMAKIAENKSAFENSNGIETAREHFASAPHLTNEFSTSVAAIKSAPVPAAANDMSFGNDTSPSAAVVAQSTKKVITADVSFG